MDTVKLLRADDDVTGDELNESAQLLSDTLKEAEKILRKASFAAAIMGKTLSVVLSPEVGSRAPDMFTDLSNHIAKTIAEIGEEMNANISAAMKKNGMIN